MKKLGVTNKYHREAFTAMSNEHDILIDHMWTLFNRLDDTDCPEFVEAAIYFVQKYDFNIDVLPPKLYNAVLHELKKQAEDAYWDMEAVATLESM